MPLRFDKHTYTLEQELYQYELQDVPEPRLFRDVFPYKTPPLIPFNHRIVPMRPPEQVWITDTTFRDGQQSRPPFTVEQIVHLFDLLHQLSGPKGMIRMSEFFLYSEKDKRALRACQERGYEYPEVTGWIRARPEDFKLVKEMGLRETGILTSVSDYHIFLKLRKTRKQAVEDYLDIVRSALDIGVTPRCHLEDVTRADFYGFVVPFVQELMKLAREARRPVKIRACDTLGLGVTYPGASMPRSVKGLIYGLVQHANVPPEWLEWHGHNDFYKGVINASTAWLYGCCAANGTLLGIGERTGNTPIEALVMEYIGLRGTPNGMNAEIITEIAHYFEKEIAYQIPANQPFVGKNFNVTRAGIHADGLSKDEEIYNIFDTAGVLKRPPSVAINDKTGRAGIVHWVNSHLKLPKTRALTKTDPAVAKIEQAIQAWYDTGRTTDISDEEMLGLVRDALPKLFAPLRLRRSTRAGKTS